MTISDPGHVHRQYADETRLEMRRSVWHPTADGRDPVEVALEAVLAALPPEKAMPDVLEVGAGPGVFAARLRDAAPQVALLATDQSSRMVELLRERGLAAQQQDVQELLAGPASFDVVAALWMLYHVPELDRGLAEIRRVLRPGGTLVAVTNGDRHTAALREEAGGEALRTSFSSENAETALHRHFDEVEREDLMTRAVFPDRETALAYLRSGREDAAWSLPEDGWPREYAGHVTVFRAR